MLFSFQIYSQSELIQGKITNEFDVEGIHILNTTSRYNATTDENGHFSIKVKPLDTILISSIKYIPEKIVITESIYEKGVLTIELLELVNELAEVVLGPNLSGNIATDLKNIKTKKQINFDDVGIQGFKGTPEEKIVPMATAFFPTQFDFEATYKYISGYYKKLKIRRSWEKENNTVANILKMYGDDFFLDTYNVPKDRVYDFLLFCVETTEMENDFKNENYVAVLQIFESKSQEYTLRTSEKIEE